MRGDPVLWSLWLVILLLLLGLSDWRKRQAPLSLVVLLLGSSAGFLYLCILQAEDWLGLCLRQVIALCIVLAPLVISSFVCCFQWLQQSPGAGDFLVCGSLALIFPATTVVLAELVAALAVLFYDYLSRSKSSKANESSDIIQVSEALETRGTRGTRETRGTRGTRGAPYLTFMSSAIILFILIEHF